MELFARFSYAYPAGDQHIKNDSEVNEILNTKLLKFLKENTIKEYRIINAETSQLPTPAFGPGNASVICTLNIAYKKEEK
jgi:hypothetical protein